MAGRKNKYNTAVKPYLEEINKKIREGVTESEIAKSLGISVATLNNYKLAHPELVEALQKNKGSDVLQKLVNSGIEASVGYYKDEITITTNAKGEETKVVSRKWYPPNPALQKFYVLNFGKAEGYNNDPLDFELKKEKSKLDEAMLKAKNWNLDLDEND